MPCIVHFEIPAVKPERVADFYENVLGWKIRRWAGPVDFWIVDTGPQDRPGINGGITRKQDRPVSGILVTAEVASVDDTLNAIADAGERVVLPKQAIPGIGWQAHFRDPEGNKIGILKNDHAAK